MPLVSSAFKTVSIRQSPAPMIIGERVNAQGSRKAKGMVLNDDYDGLVDLARRQAEAGAHCLDVSVAITEKDNELEFMTNLVQRISLEVEAPLVIDSTEPAVVESAVRQIAGRPIINSINLEGDGSRYDGMAPIMRKYGVPAIAMCIGPDGMAKTAEEKLDVAELMVKRGEEYGLSADRYIFDPLTFTLATGQDDLLDSGAQTIRGIKLIKERFPDAYTVIGLSNVSFGLDPYPRRVINSVFLYHAVAAGLDCVILNPAHTTPYHAIPADQRATAEDLIFNRRPDALASLLSSSMMYGDGRASDPGEPAIDSEWPAARRAAFRIINRMPDGLEQDVVLAIADNMESPNILDDGTHARIDAEPDVTHDAAISVLNKSLLPAMKTVGDKFGAGELILPFVLKSAECMKAAVTELEKYLVKAKGASKGTLVLGTVYGDVHDIGKNLAKTIFQNNGYTVYDLGKQVPLQTFLDKIHEVNADVVGLSALLVNTSREMKRFVGHAREHDMNIPILCGGAAIDSNFINRIATDGGTYKSGAFYCKDIFAGLNTMDRLMSDREGLLTEWYGTVGKQHRPVAAKTGVIPHSTIRPVTPPNVKLGTTTISKIDYDTVWGALNEKAVILRGWGVHGRSAGKWKEEHKKLFRVMKETVREMLEPRIVYGFFKCSSSGESLEVKGDSGSVVFDFPRSLKSKHLCIADYFGDDDIVAFQACTAGEAANTMVTEWAEAGRTTDAFYLNGFVTEFVEAMAEWTSSIIRDRMGLKRGCQRYSWGYPDCPDVTQHRLVWDILRPEQIGINLTTTGHMSPDLSTVAIVVHHPDAVYSG